mmetsp:Transcript_23979/g.66177  ORF Transcript_23979/g.66177 Transcript_23979/m.66177 type:complete len:281 (-) Transcript_23979:608-1450(-)
MQHVDVGQHLVEPPAATTAAPWTALWQALRTALWHALLQAPWAPRGKACLAATGTPDEEIAIDLSHKRAGDLHLLVQRDVNVLLEGGEVPVLEDRHEVAEDDASHEEGPRVLREAPDSPVGPLDVAWVLAGAHNAPGAQRHSAGCTGPDHNDANHASTSICPDPLESPCPVRPEMAVLEHAVGDYEDREDVCNDRADLNELGKGAQLQANCTRDLILRPRDQDEVVEHATSEERHSTTEPHAYPRAVASAEHLEAQAVSQQPVVEPLVTDVSPKNDRGHG